MKQSCNLTMLHYLLSVCSFYLHVFLVTDVYYRCGIQFPAISFEPFLRRVSGSVSKHKLYLILCIPVRRCCSDIFYSFSHGRHWRYILVYSQPITITKFWDFLVERKISLPSLTLTKVVDRAHVSSYNFSIIGLFLCMRICKSKAYPLSLLHSFNYCFCAISL